MRGAWTLSPVQALFGQPQTDMLTYLELELHPDGAPFRSANLASAVRLSQELRADALRG